MPPKKDQKKQQMYKAGQLSKDILLPSIKQQPRDAKQLRIATVDASLQQKTQAFKCQQQIEEWPGDEEAKQFNFGLESSQAFSEKSKYQLPPSYSETSSQITFWQRVKMFVGDSSSQGQNYESKEKEKIAIGSPQKPSSFKRGMLRKSTVQGRMEDNDDKDTTFLKRTGDDNDIEILSPGKGRNPWKNDDYLSADQSIGNAPVHNIKVFTETERQETEDEREERRQRYYMEKEKASKEKKKQGKKEDLPFDESLIMRKEVKMSNIDLSGFVPVFSRWIASQLQIIKDRRIKDANSGKPLHSKIYPQVDGVPVYNPSGRYWVKLYWMGKERKIEIDDRMPINARKICLFPRSAESLEIWPMIFSKALLKLHMGGVQLTGNEIYNFQEVGDGSIMYALTGLVPETLNMEQLNPDNWKFLNEMLREQHFKNESAFLTTYCYSDYKPVAPSNQITSKKDAIFETMSYNEQTKFISVSKKLQQQQLQAQQAIDRLSEPDEQSSQQQISTSVKEQKSNIQPKRNISNRKSSTIIQSSNLLFIGAENQEETKTLKIDTGKSLARERPTYVIPGFSYSIIESFYNENFNMVYTKERSEKEMQLREEYFNMLKANIHKMTREEKLEFRKRKKEIREMLHEEDKKRVELITKAPIQYKFLRIKTAASRIPLLNFVTPYSQKEIYIAQKCIINRLQKPPNYDLPEIRGDDKSVMSLSVQPTQNAEQYIQKPLEDFGNPNAKEPQKRGNLGAWILDKDFISVYQYVCIYHNLNKFQYQQVLQQQTFSDCELTKNESTEVLIIEPNDYAEMEQPEYFYSTKQSGIVFSFASLKPSNVNTNLTPYLVFQKYDFEEFKQIESLKIINRQMDGFHYQFKNEPQIFRVFINSPLGYNMWIGSTNKFQFLSVSELLTTKYGFESKIIPVEYPTLEKDKYFVLFKQKICASPNKTIFLFRIKISSNCSDAYLFQYFRFKLVTIDDSQHNIMFNTIEGVHLNLQETNYTNTNQFNRVELEQDQNYILMMEGKSPYNLQDGNFEIEILFKNEENSLNIENIEMVAPVEYNDKYLPSKYGIIFRERLYVGNTVCASFFLRLAQIPQVQESKDARPATLKGKKSQEQIDIPEIEFSCKRLVKLELFQDDHLIVYNYGFNSAYISNVFLMSTKENIGGGVLGSQPQSQHSQKGQQRNQDKSIERDDRYRNYYLQASFDLRDWPECKTLNEDTKDLIWVLRSFSSETMIMMRDTSKEDAEKELKKSWEDKEPGRAEKAKKARRKYFLQLKKDRGEELTAQEIEILNEPRLTKKQREEEQKLAGGKGKPVAGKAPAAKPAMKGLGAKKGQQDDSSIDIKERELPLSSSHNMNEIKEFLEHMEQERLIIEEPEHGGEVDIRSMENMQSIEESLRMAKEEFRNLQERNGERREQIKVLQENRKQEYVEAIEQARQEYKKQLTEILAERDIIKQQQSSKKEKEKALIALCSQEKPSQAELEKAIQEQGEDIDQRLIQIAQKVLINTKIQSVIEKLENSVGQFELDQIEETVGIIEEWQVKADENLLKNAYEIIEEAANNPDYIQQKQAELKKVSKKPGKR